MLGSINLSEFVTVDRQFNFDDFRTTVGVAVKALNEVLDEGIPLHPLQEQRDSVYYWRQIGLGIFGLADMLIKLQIAYGSKQAIDLCNVIARAMADEAIKTSALLAKQHKEIYPMYNSEAVQQSEFYDYNALEKTRELVQNYGLYNSQLLTIAPTGTLSTMLGVSGGIEPIFANFYIRKTESLHGHDEYYKVYTPIVKEYMDKHGLKDDSELPDFFVTAQSLDYKKRIDMQAIWQSHIDASISSTVNVPNDFTVEQTEDLYRYAWKKGLKGVTIFRDGCKRTGILSTTPEHNTEKTKKLNSSTDLPRGYVIKVDNNTTGKERHLNTGCGKLHYCSFFDPVTGELLEDYINKGSQGGCFSNLIGLSRLISYAARLGGSVEEIADQLISVPSCSSYIRRTVKNNDTSKGTCCPNAIGYALLDMYKEMQNEINETDNEEVDNGKEESQGIKCPQCGGNLIFEGGCNTCRSCGWSKCE